MSLIPSFRMKDAQNLFMISDNKMEDFTRQRLIFFSFYLRKAIGHIILVLFLIHVCIHNRDDVEWNMEDPLSVFNLLESRGIIFAFLGTYLFTF